MCADVKNFYYGTAMSILEYMKLQIKEIPKKIILKYDL